MEILKNYSLKKYNTFGIDSIAKEFAELSCDDDLTSLFRQRKLHDILALGGGSNMLLVSDIDKLVVSINLKGKELVSKEGSEIIVKARAGEDWPEFVQWTLANGYFGLENLTDIPGNVGTSPIQNIGAYGVEIKDVFYKLRAFNRIDGSFKEFYNADCKFGYRESVFKSEEKGKWIITDVYFKLSTKADLNIEYGAIKNVLEEEGISNPSPVDVSNCVSKIRGSKLPDPAEIGNSGSFFKNPVISAEHLRLLKESYADIPHYVISDEEVKVPAGWLIEKAGWKGYRKGDAGVHQKQALVLVNYGKAKGSEIFELAREIQSDIEKKFSIKLEIEVNII